MEMIRAIFETSPLLRELHHSRLIEFSSHEILFHLPPLKSHDPITVEHPVYTSYLCRTINCNAITTHY